MTRTTPAGRLLATLAIGLAAAATVGVGATESIAAERIQCVTPSRTVHTGPATWPLLRLAPDRIWPLSTGAGVIVALIGMDVDPDNVQLAGSISTPVRIGTDPVPQQLDCSGIGTMMAGLIVGHPDPTGTTPVTGLAPGAQLVPIMVGDGPLGHLSIPTPGQLADAVDAALKAGAQVICVVPASNQDSPQLRAAVDRALEQDVVVISAGVIDTTGGGPVGPTYPTAYPKVLSVVGVDANDHPVTAADRGDYIDIAGPGTEVWSTGPVPPRSRAFGQVALAVLPTAGAAYVAATAALVRQAYPDESQAEVVNRIIATADVAAGGTSWGVVDPYRAVTAVLTHSDTVVAMPAPVMPLLPPSGVSAATRLQAALIVAGSAAASITAVALTAAARRGRLRRWRIGG